MFKLAFVSLAAATLAQAANSCQDVGYKGPQDEGLSVLAGNSHDQHDLGYNLPITFNETTGAMYSEPWINNHQGGTDSPYFFKFLGCTGRYATKLSKVATVYTIGKLVSNSDVVDENSNCLTYKKHKNIFVLDKCSLTDDVTSNHQTFAASNTGETFYGGTGSNLTSDYGVTGYQFKGVPIGDGKFTITLDFRQGVTDANSFGTYFTD